MFKIILILFCCTVYSLCESVKFKEEKYINALQTVLHKEGELLIYEDNIKLYYPKEKKSFLFTPNHIVERKGENEKILSYEENLALNVFSKIIKTIYTNESEDLKAFFTIETKKDSTILIPNEPISNLINTIEYKKNNISLEFLRINFTNEDWIHIIENK
ncbi:MAG: hypothetical protein AB7D96_06215 [Arcobacteraceae bacterium]|jgi:hypothetical protein